MEELEPAKDIKLNSSNFVSALSQGIQYILNNSKATNTRKDTSWITSTFRGCPRPGLEDIGLLFMPDRFPESGTNNALVYECLNEAWKTAK